MLFFGLIQKFGAICELELSEISRLLATSRWLSPICPARAQLANVVPRGMVLPVQRYQDLAVELSDRSCIAVCGVLAAVGETDIVENVRQLVFRDDLADRFFHLREIKLGLLNACAGGG